jgi:hypothetical protein
VLCQRDMSVAIIIQVIPVNHFQVLQFSGYIVELTEVWDKLGGEVESESYFLSTLRFHCHVGQQCSL